MFYRVKELSFKDYHQVLSISEKVSKDETLIYQKEFNT